MKKDHISDNLCKCVLSLIHNTRKRPPYPIFLKIRVGYSDFPNVFATPTTIDVRLQNEVFSSIPVITCANSVTNFEHSPRIMKGNKGRAFFQDVYDIYVLYKTEGDQFQYKCGSVIKNVNMNIFKPLIQVESV